MYKSNCFHCVASMVLELYHHIAHLNKKNSSDKNLPKFKCHANQKNISLILHSQTISSTGNVLKLVPNGVIAPSERLVASWRISLTLIGRASLCKQLCRRNEGWRNVSKNTRYFTPCRLLLCSLCDFNVWYVQCILVTLIKKTYFVRSNPKDLDFHLDMIILFNF